MKVILLQDVAKIGRRFEVTTVPDGYALNMLLPKGMAETATPENLKKLKARTQKAVAAGAASDSAFSEALETLQGKTLTITAELNEQGHMFEALKASAIVEAAAGAGATLTEEQITLDAIKEAGVHEVAVAHGDHSGAIKIEVVAK